MQRHHYADDTQHYLNILLDSRDAVEILDPCLESVMVWLRANALKINADKMEGLLVGFNSVLGST